MPKSLEKTRKKIAKKKGNISALHENSRDSQKLRRAANRDDKLEKVASLRKKHDRPLSESLWSLYRKYLLIDQSGKSGILPGSDTSERRKGIGARCHSVSGENVS